jgi:hypothetical protein
MSVVERRRFPKILWIDQLEWYVVCGSCYFENRDHQWTGSTRFKRHSEWVTQQNDVYEFADTVLYCEYCHKPIDLPYIFIQMIQDAIEGVDVAC